MSDNPSAVRPSGEQHGADPEDLEGVDIEEQFEVEVPDGD